MIYEGILGNSVDILEFYAECVDLAKGGELFVELGAWKGRSAAFMAEAIIQSGKDIRFTVVDLWEKAEFLRTLDGHPYEPATWAEFIENVKPVCKGIWQVCQDDTALSAQYLLPGEQVDVCYVDADHRYEGCKKDIEAWWPRIKPGGILAGHDYCGEYQGVVDAVEEFAKREGLPVEHRGITWIIRRPEAA